MEYIEENLEEKALSSEKFGIKSYEEHAMVKKIIFDDVISSFNANH